MINVLGAKGNMGRRYCALLRMLNEEVTEFDLGDSIDEQNPTIIATPTETHCNVAKECIRFGVKRLLIEKPISKDIGSVVELQTLAKEHFCDVRMVCNWRFASILPLNADSHSVSYNFYNTGKDGFAWDCIQLIYLASNITTDLYLSNDSGLFVCNIDSIPVSLSDVDRSYITMLATWLESPAYLWDLEDALKATDKVIQYERTKGVEHVDFHSSKN